MMKRRLVALALTFLATSALRADFREFQQVTKDPSIDAKLRRAADKSLQDFPKLKAEDLAIAMIDLTNANAPGRGDFHGDMSFYPASVIKLFFMAETYLRHKENVPDVAHALKEMIGVSDNDATAYIVDVVCGCAPGTELQGRALRRFMDQRRVVNHDFAKLGYDVSAMMKPWSFGPYGRERQLLGTNRENRNRLTANDSAALLFWIVRRHAVSPAASDAMLALLERPLSPLREDEDQVKEFIGEALPAGARLWSKAGWTSEVRHDAAYIELPNGRRIVLVIYTRGTADDVTLIPGITRNVLGEF